MKYKWKLLVVMLVALLPTLKSEAYENQMERTGRSTIRYESAFCEAHSALCVFPPQAAAIASAERHIDFTSCTRDSEYQFDRKIEREVSGTNVEYVTTAKATFTCSFGW